MAEEVDYKHKLYKLMFEQEAVATFVKDGTSFTVGGFLINRESDCVFREIARQGQKDLKFIEESASPGVDMLIGTGQLVQFDTAYIMHRQVGGIVSMPNLERCLQEGNPRPIDLGGVMTTPNYKGNEKPLEVIDWTNFQVSLRYVAASMKIPFMPNRSSFGTDIPKYNKQIKLINDPYTDQPIHLIPSYDLDVAFITVQKADRRGNGQVWGYEGCDAWKARAAKHVVLFAEKIVSTEEIYRHPSNTIIPAYCTDAVVYLPFSSLPFPVYGCHGSDGFTLMNMLLSSQTRDGWKMWMDEWVYGCKDNNDFCGKIGWEVLERSVKSAHVLNTIPD
ncbi:MAG: CoA transferase subunit A [Deltaproteobacteria bacterium]|nr:CoA transferase subunit A [Deltaproteobacteria bacterium]